MRLTARGFKLLVRVKRLPTRVRIRYAQPDGSTTAATRRITLTAPKVVKRKTHRTRAESLAQCVRLHL